MVVVVALGRRVIPPLLIIAVIVTVLLVWIGASIVGALTRDYTLLQTTTPLLSVIVAGLVTLLAVKRRNGD